MTASIFIILQLLLKNDLDLELICRAKRSVKKSNKDLERKMAKCLLNAFQVFFIDNYAKN